MSFFAELKRRNVFRVGIAYSITGWLIAQIAGLAADSFSAPDWVMKMIIIVLMLGFPVAMVMAWAYEMTPQGLRRDSGDVDSQAQAAANTSKLDRTISIVLAAALAYFAYDKFVLDPGRDAAMLEAAAVQTQEPTITDEPEAKPTRAEIQSIAVLPFVNMSEDAGNEFFADGLSEELLNMLVKIPQLRVAARTSSFSFKEKDLTISEIADELHVSHVLEGSVRKSGNQIRITAQLIKADEGFQLWSQNYDRTLSDIFVVQDEIASKVAQALELKLLGRSRAELGIDPEAHVLYLRGLHFRMQRGIENVQKALTFYLQAVELDPGHAEAWAELAITYYELILPSVISREEGLLLVNNALEKAEKIDPNLAQALAIHSYILKNLYWDWDNSQAYIDKAYALEPNNSVIISRRGSMAGTIGKLDESVELYERAYLTDPLNLSIASALGIAYYKVHRYDEAINIFRQQAELSPQNQWAYFNIGKSYLFKGEPEQALIEMNKNPDNFYKSAGLAIIYSTLGREIEAQAALNRQISEYGQLSAVMVAGVYAWRDQKDEAFEWLEKAFEQRDSSFAYILGENVFYPLVDDPRWADLLKRLDLLEYWLEMPPEYGGPQS